jgi:hypothetical protein
LAYSTRYIPENIPIGAAIMSATAVIVTVFTRAGNSDTFSDVYLNANRSHDKCETPLIKIYIKIPTTVVIVTPAETYTILFKKTDCLFAAFMI